MTDLSNPEYPTEYYPMPGVTVTVNPTRVPIDREILALAVSEVLLRTLPPDASARIACYLSNRFTN